MHRCGSILTQQASGATALFYGRIRVLPSLRDAAHNGDVDLEKKLAAWEDSYDYHRPHGAFVGGAPYEALRERLQSV